MIFSVKAGKILPTHVRDLRGVIDREAAQIGVLISLHSPSPAMRSEAASAGTYKSPWGSHPRMHLLTVDELLSGTKIDMPPAGSQFKAAPRKLDDHEQGTLPMPDSN